MCLYIVARAAVSSACLCTLPAERPPFYRGATGEWRPRPLHEPWPQYGSQDRRTGQYVYPYRGGRGDTVEAQRSVPRPPASGSSSGSSSSVQPGGLDAVGASVVDVYFETR